MKKFLAILVAIALAAVLAVPTFAGAEGENLGTIPYTTADISIDAVMDDAYNSGLHITVDTVESGSVDTSLIGNAYLLWKDGYLYAFFKVDDPEVLTPDPEVQVSKPWGTDNVEFFIDPTAQDYNNSDEDNNLSDCTQYRLDVSGWPSVYGFKNPNDTDSTWNAYGANGIGVADENGNYADHYFEYAGNFASNVYFVEYKIPIGDLTAGSFIGIFVQITDKNTGGSSNYRIAEINTAAGSTWAWNAQCWPNATLGAAPAGATTDITDPTATDTTPEPTVDEAPTTNDNPVTADVSVIFYALASLAAVSGIVLGKKR